MSFAIRLGNGAVRMVLVYERVSWKHTLWRAGWFPTGHLTNGHPSSSPPIKRTVSPRKFLFAFIFDSVEPTLLWKLVRMEILSQVYGTFGSFGSWQRSPFPGPYETSEHTWSLARPSNKFHAQKRSQCCPLLQIEVICCLLKRGEKKDTTRKSVASRVIRSSRTWSGFSF